MSGLKVILLLAIVVILQVSAQLYGSRPYRYEYPSYASNAIGDSYGNLGTHSSKSLTLHKISMSYPLSFQVGKIKSFFTFFHVDHFPVSR